jgi:two-component system sensor histidine kinase AlgZ
LGYISAVGSQWAVPWGNPEEHHFYASLVLGTYESALTSFPLVACAGIYFAAWQWQEARERETRILRAETLAREAELRALRAELTPHFLFNTLNGISTLVGEGQTQEACRMIARLSDFLRATLENTGNNQVSLEQEIHYVQDYLAIEQERLGNRLRQRVILDPSAADAGVPTLLLQPLIENAIQHGIAPNPSGGELTVHARKHGARLRISIVNTRDAQFAAARVGSGLGIKNSRERLITAYADAADFAVLESESRWEISIELPFSQMERFDAGVARDVA